MPFKGARIATLWSRLQTLDASLRHLSRDADNTAPRDDLLTIQARIRRNVSPPGTGG